MTGKKAISSDFGNRLRKLRGKLNVSQKEMAARMGISASFLSDIEKEKAKPGFNFLSKLAEVYNISPSWVVLGVGETFLFSADGECFVNHEFGEQSEEIRNLLIMFEKSPLVRLTIMAYASKFLLNNEDIIGRNIDEHDSKKLKKS